ncbi:MAG: hypothetical protein KJ737_11695 [Proteobacteria bacterium]|nr:hypothetical protein [Pseudomonadota bacterium]
MTQKKIIKHECVCQNCGNEAEMDFECSMPDDFDDEEAAVEGKNEPARKKIKVKGTGTCISCGNEADMWIDFEV